MTTLITSFAPPGHRTSKGPRPYPTKSRVGRPVPTSTTPESIRRLLSACLASYGISSVAKERSALGFRLCVINPNSDASLTSYLREVALGVLPQGSEVEGVTCANSPRVIETSTDDVLASAEVLRATMASSNQDAFFVACFGDPAIMSLREVTRAPVVGLGTAALVQARLVTSRFGLLTTLE